MPVVDRQLLFGDHWHRVVGERWFPEEDDAQSFLKVISFFAPHLLEGSVPERAVTHGSASLRYLEVIGDPKSPVPPMESASVSPGT